MKRCLLLLLGCVLAWGLAWGQGSEENSLCVTFRLSPSDAELMVDSVSVTVDADGMARVMLAPGSHTYFAGALGYVSMQKGLVVGDADKNPVVDVTLTPFRNQFIIAPSETADSAMVFLDGRYVGDAPLILGNLAAGRHEICLMKEHYHSLKFNTRIGKKETKSFAPQMTSKMGRVVIRTSEYRPNIFIDGEYVGKVPWHGWLEEGTHVIEFRDPPRATETHVFEVVADAIGHTYLFEYPEEDPAAWNCTSGFLAR